MIGLIGPIGSTRKVRPAEDIIRLSYPLLFGRNRIESNLLTTDVNQSSKLTVSNTIIHTNIIRYVLYCTYCIVY